MDEELRKTKSVSRAQFARSLANLFYSFDIYGSAGSLLSSLEHALTNQSSLKNSKISLHKNAVSYTLDIIF